MCRQTQWCHSASSYQRGTPPDCAALAFHDLLRPRGPSLPKYVYEICKSIGFVDLDVGFVDLDIGFVDLIIGFVGVTVGFLVDLDLSVGFGGFSIGFGFVKRCTRFGGVSDPSPPSPNSAMALEYTD